MANEVPISGPLKRAFLRQCAERAKAATLTLREVLVLVQGEIFTPNFQRGRILINTSGSGQSGSFEIGVTGKAWTQENVAALTEQLINILDDCVSASVATDAADEASINALVTAMGYDDRLRGIRSQAADFSGIRC